MVLFPLLFILSLLYGLVVSVRGRLYDWGILPSRGVSVPVVCVGNVSVGGTGKTPLVRFLAGRMGHVGRIGVLSRGYGRKSRGFRWVRSDSDAAEVGDEPLELRRGLPERVVVAVCEDRVVGAERMVKEGGVEVIILDDGYQHRALRSDFSIVLTPWRLPFWRDWFLPLGSLRDTAGRGRSADAVIVTKVPGGVPDGVLCGWRGQGVGGPLRMATRLRYGRFVRSGDGASFDLKGSRVGVMVGIADPGPLLAYLEGACEVVWRMENRDHGVFSRAQLADAEARAAGVEWVVTTGKDVARLGGSVSEAVHPELYARLGVLEMELAWRAGSAEELVGQIVRRVEDRISSNGGD